MPVQGCTLTYPFTTDAQHKKQLQLLYGTDRRYPVHIGVTVRKINCETDSTAGTHVADGFVSSRPGVRVWRKEKYLACVGNRPVHIVGYPEKRGSIWLHRQCVMEAVSL